MIVYVGLDVQLHGLAIASAAELEALPAKIAAAIAALDLPRARATFDGDVEVEIRERAGRLPDEADQA